MNVSKLLAAIAAFCFLVAPAITAYAELSSKEGCKCASGMCCSAHVSECFSSDSCSSRGCPCLSQGYAYVTASIDVYDPVYYYTIRGSSRGYGRDGSSIGSIEGGTYPDGSDIDSGCAGPPGLDVVEHLPPSAQLVFSVLASDGPLTQKDLITRTELPPRTVRYALSRLKEEGVIKECFYFPDARQSLYGVPTHTQGYKAPA